MNTKKIRQYLPYIILGLCAVILLIRTRYSFCWSDETFYASTTERFLRGDGIFLHEWFPTQLVSLILMPFQAAFKAAAGSVDGILLYFRICYVIYSFAVSIIIYRILKKDYKEFTSLCCALFYFFYSHLNIATMSYYTLSVGFYLLAMLLIYYALEHAAVSYKKYYILAGISFAASVICLPTMAVAYFLCAALLVVCSIRKKKIRPVFPYTLIGICALAAVTMIFILSRVHLSDLINNLPYILSDEEHTTSLVYPFKKFFISVHDEYGRFTYLSYLLILFCLLFGRKLSAKWKIILTAIDTLLFVVFFVFSIGHTGYISTALILFALPLYFMTQKRNKPLFFLLYCAGLVFAMVFSYSSNGYLYIMTLGHSISAVGAICFLHDFRHEVFSDPTLKAAGPVLSILCLMVTGIVVVQTMTLRLVNIYRDAPLSELTAEITQGPAAGLYTTPEHRQSYDEIYTAIQEYADMDGCIFFTKLMPWGYLATDMRCGAPTTWRTPFNSKRLDLYYEANPDRIPGLIFILDEEVGSYDTCGDVVADPAPNQNEIGGWLLNYVTEHDYETIPFERGTILRKPAGTHAP